MGRVSPNYYVQDGVVPRTKLPEVLGRIRDARSALGPAHRQRVSRRRRQPASAHLLRRDGFPGQADAAEEVASEILQLLHRGGRLDHRRARRRRRQEGVHAARCSARDDLDAMQLVRCAFDPHRHLQSGQGVSDAAAVRRSAGAVPAASGRAGRPGGAVLMAVLEPIERGDAAGVAATLKRASARGLP